eukprot:TRINITY_DN2378_c0_g1_i1.p1 TRINITY_DN2378_c0_g1~~TRINITY_DN2378_c0_g1_i1.p1  ORF type:complete len:425 (+),score=89.50 TRINITY_DN2378_c0_g1_i1:77-1351(+)
MCIRDRYKEEAKKLHNSGKYEDAIQLYLQGMKHLDTLKGLPKEVKSKYQAVTNSNIAVCYKQLQDSQSVIVYSTNVIEAEGVEQEVLVKTLMIRAYAYESLDKLSEARDDWKQVKEIQWNNREASAALARIKEAFKRDKSQKVGEVLRSINSQLEEYKTTGTDKFKAGDYKEAADWFSIGIKLFTNKCDVENIQYTPKELLVVICQLYTNRAICFHSMNNYKRAVEDAEFVIEKLDSKNAKAYYRRGLAFSKLNERKRAVEDFEKALSFEPNNKLVKSAMEEIRESSSEDAKEVEIKAPTESTKDSIKRKGITEEQISKATEIAAKSLGKDYLKKPKTAYSFENIWRSYKNNYAELAKFLEENAEPDYLGSLFKDNEIPGELYLSIIKTLKYSFKTYVMIFTVERRKRCVTSICRCCCVLRTHT